LNYHDVSSNFQLLHKIVHLYTTLREVRATGRESSRYTCDFHAKRSDIGKDTSSPHYSTSYPNYQAVDHKVEIHDGAQHPYTTLSRARYDHSRVIKLIASSPVPHIHHSTDPSTTPRYCRCPLESIAYGSFPNRDSLRPGCILPRPSGGGQSVLDQRPSGG